MAVDTGVRMANIHILSYFRASHRMASILSMPHYGACKTDQREIMRLAKTMWDLTADYLEGSREGSVGEGQHPSVSHRKGEREIGSERISSVLAGLEGLEVLKFLKS